MQDYIIKSDKKPNHFFHCFGQIEEKIQSNFDLEIFFSVLIFFEEIIIKKSNEKYFIPKAFLIISENPYFLLHKYILETIYLRCLSIQEYPIELLILTFFSLLKKNKLNNAKIFSFNNFFKDFQYLIDKETFLPILDFNIGPFFSFFNFDEFILLAEFFFTRSTILIYTDEVEKLFPFYFILMNLIYPLKNNANIKYEYYQYCTSSTFFHIIKHNISCFIAINYNLTEDNLCQFTSLRNDRILAVDLKNFKMKIYKPDKIDNHIDNFSNNGISIEENSSILRIIFDNLIEKDKEEELKLTNIISFYVAQIKQYSREKLIFTDFLDYSLINFEFYNLTKELRKLLFSLFIKLLIFHQPFTNFVITENNNIELRLEENKFLDSFCNPKIKDFFSFFITTSTFCQICYRDGINPLNIKNFIIISELIKIYTIDKDRIYFDIFNFSFSGKKHFKVKPSLYNDKIDFGKIPDFNSGNKEIKIIFEELHSIILNLINENEELKYLKIDKFLIKEKLKVDNVIFYKLKYIYLDMKNYQNYKYQKQVRKIFKEHQSDKGQEKSNSKNKPKRIDTSIKSLYKECKKKDEYNNEYINLDILDYDQELIYSSNVNLYHEHKLKLDTDKIIIKEKIYKSKYKCDILIIELFIIQNLISTDSITILNIEEIINVCYIIFLTITIFFEFSNTEIISSMKKINFIKFTEIYKIYLNKIKEVKSYFFIHSIIFEIINYLDLKEIYGMDFLKVLQTNNVIPSLSITMNLKSGFKKDKSKHYYNDLIIDENIFDFSKFNKSRKNIIDRYYNGYNKIDEYILICCQHDINFNLEKDNFINIIEINGNKNLKCRNQKNSHCEFFLIVKNKSICLFHPSYLLLFLLNKIIKNNSLTFNIEKFFSNTIEEDYFYNLMFYFRTYKLDTDLLLKN